MLNENFRSVLNSLFYHTLQIARRNRVFSSSKLWMRSQRPGNFFAHVIVLPVMEKAIRQFGAPEWLVLIGASVFILVLAVSAFFEPDIRWLHFFQAWMYIATIGLSVQNNRWGHFIGISVAGFWDYANVFATTFFFNGLEQLSQWVHTGHLARPDLFIAVPAWFSNLLVVIGCMWAYSRKPTKPRGDIIRFLVSFILSTGFFAVDMALFQPRYLDIFRRLLHPHLP